MRRVPIYPHTSMAKKAAAGAAAASADEPVDGYQGKLLKYIPAEVLSALIPLYASAPIAQLRPVLVGLGLIISLGLLWAAARDKKVPLFFFVLAAIAYGAWVCGTTSVLADLFPHTKPPGPDTATLAERWSLIGRWVLGLAAFGIPAIDGILTTWEAKRQR